MSEWLMQGIPRTIADEPDLDTVRRIRDSITSDTGQVVESDMLLPCPLCGARPYMQTHELGDTCVEARVVCPSCHVSTTRETQSWRIWHGHDDLTRTLAIGRAISAWNRRAGQTCRNELSGYTDYAGRPVPYQFRCSECGEHSLTMFDVGFGDMVSDAPCYCPRCGARVVSGDVR